MANKKGSAAPGCCSSCGRPYKANSAEAVLLAELKALLERFQVYGPDRKKKRS